MGDKIASRSMIQKGFPVPMFRISLLLSLALVLPSSATAEWKEQVLYSFQGGTNDGALPVGGIVSDSKGNLYGVLQDFGSGACSPIGYQCGAVFQLSPPAQLGQPWTETLIYTFQGEIAQDGESPNGGLIIDRQGNLYGVTAYGVTGNCVLIGVKAGCGTVYELSPPKQKGGVWTETILYSFPTAAQGYFPNGNLVFDSAGNLYGATTFGGTKGTTCDEFYGGQCGVVFELSPPTTTGGEWTETVLHNFSGITAAGLYGDGAEPNGGLIMDSKGAIYGTTFIGGYNCPHSSNQGCGTVFRLTPMGPGWTQTVLRHFHGSPDARGPAVGLTWGAGGVLYGTTVDGGGGNTGSGTVFKVAQDNHGSWEERVLYSFQDGDDGAQPMASITIGPRGYLYGTATIDGGRPYAGTLFQLRENQQGNWVFTVVYSFKGFANHDGAYPHRDYSPQRKQRLRDDPGRGHGTRLPRRVRNDLRRTIAASGRAKRESPAAKLGALARFCG